MNTELQLDGLDRKEALRYLGYGRNIPEQHISELIDECEKKILETAKPRYIYKVFDIKEYSDGIEVVNTNLLMPGNSIKNHLLGCDKAVLMGVTISSDIDRLIRITQIKDMAKAVIMDSLASVAVEQACEKTEEVIKKEYSEYNQTWRFGVGYGDLPLDIERDFVKVINASKIIGLCTNASNMLIPTKSVTAIIGLSKGMIDPAKKGCQTCNMRDRCRFRGEGGHCNV